MDASIIIINYNTFKLTSNCIRSVYKYTTGLQFEIILVDNASEECDTGLFIKEFPDIVLIKNKENTGFSKGNNIGIAAARGDTILLLNSDTELTENSVFDCYRKLNELGPEVAVITCKLIYPDGLVQKQCSRFPAIFTNLIELTRVHKLLSKRKRAELLLGSYFDHETDCFPEWCWGTFFMFKKALIEQLPGRKLNDEYFMYCEDMKWCYDFRCIGKKVFYNAGTKVTHLVGQSSKSNIAKTNPIVYYELNWVAKRYNKMYMAMYALIKGGNLLLSGASNANGSKHFKAYINSAMANLSGKPLQIVPSKKL